MIPPEECAVVIPCFNEEAAIYAVVQDVKKRVATVIVIDDGSTDKTADRAKLAGAEVLTHAFTRGKGAALNSGWALARQRGFKWVFSMDGDGQHLAEDIPNFLSEPDEVDLIVGNRFANPKEIPWLRRQVNRYMSWQLSKIGRQQLPDSQCGFRLMRLEAWANITLQTAHFEIESEVLLAFLAQGYKIKFVPIHVVYGREQSKINPVRDTIRWFDWLRRLRTSRK